MRTKLIVMLAFAGMVLFSCKQNANQKVDEKIADNAILQQQDGTISLEVTKADTYQDSENPQSNTAEWSVVVSKSGRFKVWLSSATKDTTRLKYDGSVMVSVKDDRIEARPAIDKVIRNSTDVSLPYYRTDSFLGELYLQDTGVYNIQVISDRIIPDGKKDLSAEDTKLLSVSLTPATN
jgi:outer membrane lipoprotein-sorting protein